MTEPARTPQATVGAALMGGGLLVAVMGVLVLTRVIAPTLAAGTRTWLGAALVGAGVLDAVVGVVFLKRSSDQ
ncbi:MAG: hypothetical protein R2752_03635 [Vicinamibacterales bacterium]